MSRLSRLFLIGSTIAFSWLGMMVVHEAGHVVHLGLSGGTVEKVVLHPLAISRTDPGENPHPLFVAWGGVIWGCLIPLATLGLICRLARPYTYLARFFAGFCLTANGAYLLGDALVRGGDARELIRHGTPPWVLMVCGLAALGAGLTLWNGLGPRFGVGRGAERVDPRVALAVTLALACLVVLEIALFGR
ncbi:hypothetical protein ACFL5Q_01770 [Planctomycetota bacterium]